MSKKQRVNILEKKLEQLYIYHDKKCPNKKIEIVQKLIAHYERILDSLNPNQSLITA